ncbi:uncharacterized protein At3g49140-like [Silene latifolia]|uniref:uncharacterized protein At3g49140-like n=1 Tax=Silene latifolia TaxID=37657 RepID=UPI003D76C9E7
MFIDSSMAAHLLSSSSITYCHPIWSSDDVIGINFAVPWNKVKKLRRKFDSSLNKRKGLANNRIQACGKYLGSGFDQVGRNGKSGYHPFEDISDSEAAGAGDGRLSPAETSRTIIEVNSEATLMFSGLINDEVYENIFWPELPYLTDEHGNVYFQVNNDEDIMQTLTSDNNYVQVIIGLDTKHMSSDMELSGPASIDFGIEGIEEEIDFFEDDDDDDAADDDDSDDDGDHEFEGGWIDTLEDEEDQGDSDGSLGDWANLETMRSSHPMYFAKKIAEVVSDDPIDFMDQQPAGIAVRGLLRPAFIEEQSVIQKHMSSHISKIADSKNLKAQKDNSVKDEELQRDNGLAIGTAFYKLEMVKIQLISADGNKIAVDVEDYRKAFPDAIAHSAAKIISRVNAAGEKTTNALKSLCRRCNDLQVEEASLIGIDALGFDLRVCSGTQVQTLRFTFNSQATSEYSAERHLNDALFPRNIQKVQKLEQARRRES